MIRTVDDLVKKIDEDLLWRRKELTELRGIAHDVVGPIKEHAVIRSAASLLYAHWEGFVKKSSSYYLEFVASQRLPYSNLAPNFVAISLRKKFSELGVCEKVSGANSLADFFCKSLGDRSNLPYKNAIDTKSNLSSKTFLDILLSLGIPKDQFLNNLEFIDQKLVNRRNYIAHGEKLDLTMRDYIDLHDKVMDLLDTYRNEVQNAAARKLYERQ